MMSDIHEKVAATGRRNIERLIEMRPSTLEGARDYLSEVVPILTFIADHREFATNEDGRVQYNPDLVRSPGASPVDPKYSHPEDKDARISYLGVLKRLCTIVGDLEVRYWDDLSEAYLLSRDAAIVWNLRRAIYLAIDRQQNDVTIDRYQNSDPLETYHPVYRQLCEDEALMFEPGEIDRPFRVIVTYKKLQSSRRRCSAWMQTKDFVKQVRRQSGKPLKDSDIDKL